MSRGPDDENEDPAEATRSAGEETEQQVDTAIVEDEEEWKFSVDDFPDTAPGSDDSGESGSNVAGTMESRQPLEPGDIDLENAFFVALGIFIVVGLIVGAMLGF